MVIHKGKEAVTNTAISIEDKVAFLKQPESYPFPISEVKTIETHMSWVFLAGNFVYKLKKPVRYYLFDHRSIKSRRKNSEEEFHINKPLAKDIYQAVLPLVVNKKGMLQIDGKGRITDWLVKMKRIQDENMLDYAILHDCADDIQVVQAATLLAGFYTSSVPFPVTLSEYSDQMNSQVLFNQRQLRNPLYNLPLTLIEELAAGQRAFLLTGLSLFKKRIADKKIIDAHGDLRPEHICLAPHAAIIDRLEFCKDLRIMDVAEELSFLAMECEMMGNTHIGRIFLDVYSKSANDIIPPQLIYFFKIKRACLRAYLVARHIEESRYKDDPKWLNKANGYLRLAENYHRQLAT